MQDKTYGSRIYIMSDVQHSIDWGGIITWGGTAVVGMIVTIVRWIFGLHDKSVKEISQGVIDNIMEKMRKEYTHKEFCAASHALTDQTIKTILVHQENLDHKMDIIISKL